MYNALGRAAIRFSARYLRTRYRRQIRIGLGVAAIAAIAGLVAYLTARDVPEG
jgi:hypothetical protein